MTLMSPLYYCTLYIIDQVPAFQASPEGKTGCTRGSEKEGGKKSGQSCEKEKDPGMSRNVELAKLNIFYMIK